MEDSDPNSTDAKAAISLNSAIAEHGSGIEGFARLLCRLGDCRDVEAIAANIDAMVTGTTPVTGQMRVILTLIERERLRSDRLARSTTWEDNGRSGYVTEIAGVRLSVSPESHGRWSVHARHVAAGMNGYSPPVPHWRHNLDDAKRRAIMAVDDPLDQVEENESLRVDNGSA